MYYTWYCAAELASAFAPAQYGLAQVGGLK
jgi:hypothetical protein